MLVQQADTTRLFTHTASRVVVDNKAHAASVCGYTANSNTDPNTIDNIIETLLVYVYDGTTRFTQTKAADSQPIANLGDSAFQVTRGDLLSVAFLAHGQTVEIDFSITGLADHPAVATVASQVTKIARQALTRMSP